MTPEVPEPVAPEPVSAPDAPLEVPSAEAPPAAPPPPPVPEAPEDPEDPEFDLGERGKWKRSHLNGAIGFALEQRERMNAFEAEQKALKERAAMFESVGAPIEDLVKYVNDLGPAREQYLQGLDAFNKEFRAGNSQHPQIAMATQMAELRKFMIETEAWKKEEMQARENWRQEQYRAKLASEYKSEYNREPNPLQIEALNAALAREPGKDPRFVMRSVFGPPVQDPGPATSAPTRSGSPPHKTVDNMTEAEENQFILGNLKKSGVIK